MKLRNKKTGEIIETDYELSVSIPDDEKLYGNDTYTQIKGYSSIKELSEDWEDYEEPEEHFCVTMYGGITRIKDDEEPIVDLIDIGNYFNSKEDAYDALDKLKTWKRLKDKGFRFDGIKEDYTRILQSQDPFRTGKRYLQFSKSEDEVWMKENWQELELLFGGEK